MLAWLSFSVSCFLVEFPHRMTDLIETMPSETTPTVETPTGSAPPAENDFVSQMETRQKEVLDALDRLNVRIEAAISQFGEQREPLLGEPLLGEPLLGEPLLGEPPHGEQDLPRAAIEIPTVNPPLSEGETESPAAKAA